MDKKQIEKYFENSELNQKLLKLYKSKCCVVKKVCEAYNKNKVFDPHTNKELSLVFHSSCVPHNYECKNMIHKILIVGQETNGWEFKENAKESILFTLGFLYSPQHNGKLSFTFPFEFCKSINDYDYNENYRKTYFAWVSLRKFAYNERQFARVEHEALPKNSFRIYRPEYLNRIHLKNEYLERLKKECGL